MAFEKIDLAELRRSLSALQTSFNLPDAEFVSLKTQVDSLLVYKGIKDEQLGQSPIIPTVDLSLLNAAGTVPEDDAGKEKLIEDIGKWQSNLQIKVNGIVKVAEAEQSANNQDLLTLITLDLNPSEDLGKVFLIIKGMGDAKFPEETVREKVGDSIMLTFDSLKEYQTIQFAVPDRINPADLEIIVSPEFSNFVLTNYACGNSICEQGEDYKTCPEDCKKPVTIGIEYYILILIAAAGGIYWIWKFYAKMYEKKLEEKLFKNRADLYSLTFFITKALNKGEKDAAVKQKLIAAGWKTDQTEYALQKIKRERRLVQLNTLMNFIYNNLRAGNQEIAIKKELKDAGWMEKDINYAYKKTLKRIEKEKKKLKK